MATEPFKTRILGIVILGVLSSLIAASIWSSGSHFFSRVRVGNDSANKSEQPSNTATLPPSIDSESTSLSEAIRDYSRAYVDVTLSGPTSLERLYHQANSLASQMTIAPSGGGASFIERLQPSHVDSLAQQLPGVFFSRK